MTTLLSLHTDFPVLLFLLQLSLWCCLKRASAMVNLTQSLRFPDKPAEALPSSPNTSVTAPQPKQATAMKNVLAGFGSGVSKPPNRSSPAPAAAQNAQNANQAPNPASAFSGLVNNISNSAKKQEQGSFEQIFFWIRSLPTSLKLEWTCWDEMLNPPKIFTKRDQIFDWNHYLGHPHLVKRCRDISKLSKRLIAWCQTTPSLIWLFFQLSLFSSTLPLFHFLPFPCSCVPPTHPPWIFTAHHHQRATSIDSTKQENWKFLTLELNCSSLGNEHVHFGPHGIFSRLHLPSQLNYIFLNLNHKQTVKAFTVNHTYT